MNQLPPTPDPILRLMARIQAEMSDMKLHRLDRTARYRGLQQWLKALEKQRLPEASK